MNPRRTAPWLLTFGLFLSTGLRAAEQAPAAVETVTGRVFLDANANGRLDEGEKGLAGVAVTDSVNFVTTGDDGSYTIKVADDPVIPYKPARVVSISWPSGKWPTGAWWKRLSDIKPGRSVDFGLRDDEQKLPFIFVHITDDHGWGNLLPAFGKEIGKLGERVKLCFHTGDMGYADVKNADELFSSVAKNAKAFPLPMFFTPGNRDIVQPPDGDYGAQRPLIGNGAFTKHLGPVRWSFDYAGRHFVGVDWMRWPDGKLEEGTPRIALEWLEKDLSRPAPGTRIFAFIHFFAADSSFLAVIRKHKVTHVLGGHNHEHLRYLIDGVAGTTTIGLRGNGGCTLGIVGESGFDAVFRCAGCKGKSPTDHTPLLCAQWKFEQKLLPALKPRRGRRQSVAEAALGPATKRIQVGQAAAVEIAAEIQPGTAGKVGLRIECRKPFEIAYDGKSLNVAGVEIPFSLRADEKALKWHIVLEKDRLTIYANSLFQLDKAVGAGEISGVVLFAEGGTATVRKLDVWELRKP